MSGRTLAPALQRARRSPNRARLVARVWVWTLGLSGVALVVPHVLF